MQDVLFNGSGNRKPVNRASVELLFDNSLGKAAGQWSTYAEISVKRMLERDGDRFRVRYVAHSREALERYLQHHAPRLRADVSSHFPDGVVLSRAEWTSVEWFEAGTQDAG